MSIPISARLTCADTGPIRVIRAASSPLRKVAAPIIADRVSTMAPGTWNGQHRQQFVDASGYGVDVCGRDVDLAEQRSCQLGVMIIESTGQRLDERCPFGSHLAARQIDEQRGVAFAGDERLQRVAH